MSSNCIQWQLDMHTMCCTPQLSFWGWARATWVLEHSIAGAEYVLVLGKHPVISLYPTCQLSGRIDSSAQIYDIQSMNSNIELNCPHCSLYVRVSPCSQEALNHFVVTMEACSPQWCHTIKGNVSEWVSEVSCHRLVETGPVTNAMLQCSENVATVHKERSIMIKQCIMHTM